MTEEYNFLSNMFSTFFHNFSSFVKLHISYVFYISNILLKSILGLLVYCNEVAHFSILIQLIKFKRTVQYFLNEMIMSVYQKNNFVKLLEVLITELKQSFVNKSPNRAI